MEGLRVIPTYECNKNCYMCYQKDKQSGILLPDKLSDVLYDILTDYPDFKPKYITLMGGELSLFPKETVRYIQHLKAVFPRTDISLTTNGTGDMSFYMDCINKGINNITFSLHSKDEEVEDKLLFLQKRAINVRVNCFLDFDKEDKAQYVFKFCEKNLVPLTFCCDLRTKKRINLLSLGDFLNICKPHYFDMESSHATCKIMESSFTFWVFWSSDYEDTPNIIILPNGTVTTSFEKVLNGEK